MKKLLAMIIAAMLILSMVACANGNEDETSEEEASQAQGNDSVTTSTGTFQCGTNADGDYEIIKYVPASVAVVDIELPAQVDGRDIVGVGEGAFKAENSVKSIKLPSTYQYIGDYAFYDCDSLTTVTMADSLLTVGKHAFAACDLLSAVTFSKGLTTVSDFAFAECVALTAADLSGAITTVGNGAFMSCTALKTVTLAASIKTITRDAFAGCSQLTYTVDGGAKYLGTADNPHYVLIGAETLNVEAVTVNAATVVIASKALSDCPTLKTVTLGDKVAVIDANCFTGSDEMVYTEYENARYLGTAENPHAVMLSAVLTGVDSMHIHANTKIISDTAFAECVNLSDISFPGTEEAWKAITKSESWNHGMNVEIHYTAAN